jgi:hypothetical protein
VRLSARLGLLGAMIALPLGAALVGHVFGQQPVPAAPAEVRIGGSLDQKGATSAVSSLRVPAPAPGHPAGQPEVTPTTLAAVVPPAPPVVAAEATTESTTTNGETTARGKDKAKNPNATSHPTPATPTPTSHAVTGRNG